MNCPQCQSLQSSQSITCQTCHHPLRNAQLRVVRHDGHDQIVSLPLRAFTIGRHEENDLVLALDGISRRHSRFLLEEGRYWIEDCGSKNGLFVNGQKSDKRLLQDQDCLQIGPVRLFFVLTNSATTEAEPTPNASSEVHRHDVPKVAAGVEMMKYDE